MAAPGAVPVAALGEFDHGTGGAEQQNHGRSGDQRQHRHLHFLAFDLLAEVLRRAAHHQSGDEHREDGEQQHAVESRADAAEDDFAQVQVEERNQAAQGSEAIVHADDGAAAGVGGDGGEQRRGGDAEAHFLAFHVAARACSRPSLVRIGLPACSK